MNTPLDIIIPAYNNIDITFRCLAALRLFAPQGTHVILVDNGSRDNPKDAVHTLKASVESMGGTYLRLDPNRGPYGAVNAGYAHTKSDVIGVVCNDVVVLPGTLYTLLDAVHQGLPCVGASEVLMPDFNYTGVMSWAGVSGRLNAPAIQITRHYFSCFLAHRSLYDHVGLYDERFGLTFGDTDHEQRILDAGIQPVCLLNALVYHGHGTGRKRGGIDADIETDLKDHRAFLEKWKDRPDVLAKHPIETAERKKTFLEKEGWVRGER